MRKFVNIDLKNRAALSASYRFTLLLHTYLTVCSEAAMQQFTKQT